MSGRAAGRLGSRALRAAGAGLVLALAAAQARATWSIVLVDHRTGEVAIGSCTCINGLNLQRQVPVVVTGVGAGAAQSLLDSGAVNRMVIEDGLRTGLTPQEILDGLALADGSHQQRQYGIVSFGAPPVTFTGTGAGAAALGVTGTVGDMSYAIQGNVLAGDPVVFAAEQAVLTTAGDVGQKLMAGMEAARALGGDGRCSCSASAPDSCGTPPPGSWVSARVGFVIVARMGDPDPGCVPGMGCASGDYYLSLNKFTGGGVDPVLVLQTQYDAWRAGLVGRPDHVLSTVEAGAARLPADGVTQTTVTVRLVDVDGTPLTTGGATVTVTRPAGRTPHATAGPVTDHGDGSYGFTLTAGTTTGTDTFVIRADDGTVAATLYPYLEVESVAPQPLHVGFDELSAAAGGTVPFVVNEPGAPGAGFVLLASASGTTPGAPVGDLVLPLNPDAVFLCSVLEANTAVLPGSLGLLGATGRAEPAFVATPGMLDTMTGRRLDWAVLHLGAGGLGVTNAVGFDVVP